MHVPVDGVLSSCKGGVRGESRCSTRTLLNVWYWDMVAFHLRKGGCSNGSVEKRKASLGVVETIWNEQPRRFEVEEFATEMQGDVNTPTG